MKQYDSRKPKIKTRKLAKKNAPSASEVEAIDMLGLKRFGKSPRTMSKMDIKNYHKSRGTSGRLSQGKQSVAMGK